MKLIDPSHAFYRPLWVRILIVASLIAWFGLELMIGASFWLVIVGALAVYCTWMLILRFPEPKPAEPVVSEKDEDAG